ncbi:Regulator of nonsense transcripts 1-like protein [Hypsibius exemplaris]|uniref:Regulator of nonsense transcripts 1-like protein n=1 Tax=Hypsibius exemplaris TaxID=2072580 RepID=A0A1W0WR80_HYPEX|nr:Regulator of nonsense transcripts 1-like protein [Hypsibius exemplaris]
MKDGCSFCGQAHSEFLVKCVKNGCGKWFCNGSTDSNGQSGPKESHIISHLRISRHREIAVPSCPTETGDYQLFYFCCMLCDRNDSFDMGMETAGDGRNASKHLCRQDALELGKFSREGSWVPFVDVHHRSLKCFNENIVKVPAKHDQVHLKRMSHEDIAAVERSWLLQAKGLANIDLRAASAQRWIDFETVQQYRDHFSALVRLECKMEEADSLAIPILEDIRITRLELYPNSPAVAWFEFEMRSQVHQKALGKGQRVLVNLEYDNCVVANAGSVASLYLRNGSVVVCVKFSERTVRREQLVDAVAVGIEISFQDTMYRRWLIALAAFAADGVADKELRGFILGQPVGGELDALGPSSSESSKKRGGSASKKKMQPQKAMKPAKLPLELFPVPNQGLMNEHQTAAVQMAMSSTLSLIQGPPGTGKTHTIVAIVYNILKRNPRCQVLCCAPSNDPTDHLAVQLAASGMSVLRVHSQRIQTEQLKKNVKVLTLRYKLELIFGLDFENSEDYDARAVDQATYDIIGQSQVICTTCNTAAARSLSESDFPFVIIDEATQATEADIMIPITKGCQKLVLIGDEKQLGVLGKFRELEKTNQCWSMFERLLELQQAPRVMLTVQYRMHPEICRPASLVMYEGLLTSGPDVAASRASKTLHFLNPTQTVMIDTSKFHEQASDGVSFLNVHEAVVVALCLANLIHGGGVKPADIGVITFYNGQKDHLKKQVEKHDCIHLMLLKEMMIDSVDAFQGREKDYIILSCVRSGHVKSTSVGFLADERRLNVALTRARKGVIIVGNRGLLEKCEIWRRFLEYYPLITEKSALCGLGVRDVRHLRCVYCDDYRLRSVAIPAKTMTFSNSTKGMHTVDDVEASMGAMHISAPRKIYQPSLGLDGGKKKPWKTPQNLRRAGRPHAGATDVSPDELVQYMTGWSTKDLHQALGEYAMSMVELKARGYPFVYKAQDPIPDDRLLFLAQSSKIDSRDMTAPVRTCERCQKTFHVTPTGHYVTREQCRYHTGKRSKPCCKGELHPRTGCVTAPGHVSKTFTSMRDFVSTKFAAQDKIAMPRSPNILAMDCEMLYTLGGYEVGRVTLVDHRLQTVYDCFVLPQSMVIDYNTRFSGLTEACYLGPEYRGVPVKCLADVHRDLIGRVIHEETILVGHSLESDLICLKMIHHWVVDTSWVFQMVGKGRSSSTPSLRSLMLDHLQKTIQAGTDGHDSSEDAAACMELMLWNIGRENFVRGG